jgi:hypothetical protein
LLFLFRVFFVTGAGVTKFQHIMLQFSLQLLFGRKIELITAGEHLFAFLVEHIGVFDGIYGVFRFETFVGQRLDAFLITTLEQSFKQKRVDLSLQPPGAPFVFGGFNFVEIPSLTALNLEKRVLIRVSCVCAQTEPHPGLRPPLSARRGA